MTSRLLTLIAFFALISTACQKQSTEYHDSFLAFGTLINVTLIDVDEKLAQQSFTYIREDFKSMHRAWHVWEPGPLMRTNQLLETQAEFSAAPSVVDVIQVAKELSEKSHNLFNPAIGKLISLWGFHSHQEPRTPPSDLAIQKLLKLSPKMQDVKINGFRMRSSNSAVKIDLGGVAKGYAIDGLLQYLKQHGVNNALINTGGDLKVIGRHAERPWKVAIRDPRSNKRLVASLEVMDNEAVFTSGDYERYLKNKKNNDRHLHHIIDPRTGYPAIGTQSVTVLHNNAATADAAATALFIAGPELWIKIAKSMGIKYVLLIDKNGNLHMSSAMQKRIILEPISEAISEPISKPISKLEQPRKIIQIINLE